jgi:coiled-coil domain-containing protein 61
MEDHSKLSSEVFEREWTREFHGVTYQINICVVNGGSGVGATPLSGSLLKIEVEQVDDDSNDRWSSEFTSQYIEEITHKAGNFKKFAVFSKMLSAAFTEAKDNVLYVDLLTSSDLEMLKARKSTGGDSHGGQFQASSGGVSNKRYIILTYSGEFDRVHYPLPLVHEDPLAPNIASWKRTIKRLRQQVKDKPKHGVNSSVIDPEDLDSSLFNSEKDKNRDTVRQIVTQLRQENTELKHRLRQMESRANSTNSMGKGPGGNIQADLIADNTKLRKQNQGIKKELAESSSAYEKLRIEMAKEIGKWKSKLSSTSFEGEKKVGDSLDIYNSNNSNTFMGSNGGSDRGNSRERERVEPRDREEGLKRRIATLERDLLRYDG